MPGGAAAAALAACSLGANAALTTLPVGWPPLGSSGLQGVLFNVQTSGDITVAMGAHAYKNSAFLANDGVSTFYADGGLYAPDGKNYANWSFDFVYDLGSCTACKVFLSIDSDPTSGVSLQTANLTEDFNFPDAYAESWNMEMPFLAALNFNPFAASSTAFQIYVTDANNVRLVTSDITVNVPEPGTLALAGLALFGMAALRRRKA